MVQLLQLIARLLTGLGVSTSMLSNTLRYWQMSNSLQDSSPADWSAPEGAYHSTNKLCFHTSFCKGGIIDEEGVFSNFIQSEALSK